MESPVLPSYSMPKALICERCASAVRRRFRGLFARDWASCDLSLAEREVNASATRLGSKRSRAGVKDGMVARRRLYFTEAEALEAAGLRE